MRKHVNDCGSCYFALISMEMRWRGRCHIGSALRALSAGERGSTRERPICFPEDYGRLLCIKAIKFKRRREKKGADYNCRLAVDQRPLNNAAAGQESEKRREKGGSLSVISASAASTRVFFSPSSLFHEYLALLPKTFGNHLKSQKGSGSIERFSCTSFILLL